MERHDHHCTDCGRPIVCTVDCDEDPMELGLCDKCLKAADEACEGNY